MVEHLLEYLPVSHKTTLLDVYCGVGLFSAFFAGRVGRLVAVELSPSACEDFATNLDEFDNVELYEAPAEIVLPTLDVSPDVVIVDPPRAWRNALWMRFWPKLQRGSLMFHVTPPRWDVDVARFIAG